MQRMVMVVMLLGWRRRRLLVEAGTRGGQAGGRGHGRARGLAPGHGGGVEVGHAVARDVRAGVALLVAREEVQADELLVTAGHVALVYLLWVVWREGAKGGG